MLHVPQRTPSQLAALEVRQRLRALSLRPTAHPDDIFGPVVHRRPDSITGTIAERIMDETSGYFRVQKREICSSRRHAYIVRARHMAAYLLSANTGLSFPAIGRILGGQNHSTIIHSARKIQGLLCANDPETVEAIDTIQARISA